MSFLSLFMAALLSSTSICSAEETGRLSLTDGIVVNNAQGDAKDLTKESLEYKIAEEEAIEDNEGKGFLSFLNFSFFDKKDNQAIAPKEDETPEDFYTRVTRRANANDVNALMTLGYMHIYGLNGAEMNYKKAYECYQKAAELGDPIAINNLGSLYYGGVGVRKNVRKAAELFAQASDLGNTEASLNLAVIYLKHEGGFYNDQEAAKLLKKTAEHDNPTGKYLLGYAYMKGIGVPENKKKAVENIRFAADKGYDEAQYMMGYFYKNGIGVTQNYNNSLRYLNKAVSQGNISAIVELGRFYVAGDRIEPDYYKGYVLFNIAAYYGVANAAEARDKLAGKALKKQAVLQAQTESENFKPSPTQLTKYIRQTFGKSLALYIDKNAPIISVNEN